MANPARRQERRKRVLAVDDEQEILHLYTTFLQYRGYDVITADNAEACLDFLKNDTVDMLLLDVNMPGIDGLKVLEMVRSDARSRHMRVLMVTARRDGDTVRDAGLLGCDGFIVKPFKLKELAERIETELFSISDSEVRSLFRTVLTMRPGAMKELGLTDENQHQWDPYVIPFKEASICVLVPRGVRPAQFAKVLPVELEKRIMVFHRHPQKWKKIWPLSRKK